MPSRAGQRVAVIERGLIGGSCPNIACLPSKNIIHSARVAALSYRHAEFGIVCGGLHVDMKAVRQRKRSMVEGLIATHRERYEASGAELILGEGRFVAPQTLEIELQAGGARVLSAPRVVIDVGTHAAIPAVPGLAQCYPLSHVEALELDHIPGHLLVLGGGYVGLEFAQAMRRFGSRVTVVDQAPQLAVREDIDVGLALRGLFEDEGIEVVLGAEVLDVEGHSGKEIRLRMRTAGGERVIRSSDILVAAGREPNTRGIGLDIAGVELDERGYVRVNDRLETTALGVWAVGDCAGSPQFTHVGFDDFRIVRDNWNGGHRTTRDRLIPYCMFTDPELARVGLNEVQARRAGIEYRVARLPMAAVLRAQTLSETRGFMKALVDAHSDRILGFTVFGAEAGELVAVVQTAMLTRAPYTVLRDAILTHPTMAEGLTSLFREDPQPTAALPDVVCHL